MIDANSISPASAIGHPHSTLGTHYLLECSGCRAELLTDLDLLKATMQNAATKAGATVVETVLHQFNPHGLSGVVVIAESHLAIHTWPEHHYAAIDIFTCGDAQMAEHIFLQILEAFCPQQHTVQKIQRNPPSAPLSNISAL